MDAARGADTDEAEEGDEPDSARTPGGATQHLPSSNRQMRNMAEKMRRDKLNTYISELATLVPMVAKSPKRMDKTSILRLTATYLRMNRTLTCADKEKIQLPSFLDSSCLYPQGFLEDMKGFLLVVTMAGKIVFVTHTVEKLLGHSQNDLFGQSLYNITCPEDHAELTRNLTPDPDPSAPDIFAGAASGADDSSSDDASSSSSQQSGGGLVVAVPDGPPPPTERQKRCFHLRLSQRAASRGEAPQYELVRAQGHLRVPQLPREESSSSKMKNDTVLVAVVTLFSETHIADMTLMEATRDEYITRHLIDGRFIYCDHRIAVVSGYLPEEVSGVSAFKFMHKDDFLYTMIALRQMYDRYGQGEGYGSSVYRLRCKNGQYIYMRTHGYVEYSKSTHQVESFICVNSLISEEEGVSGLKEMQSRYSASIIATGRAALMGMAASPEGAGLGSGSDKPSTSEDVPQADGQDPLDLAISQLISNFPSPAAGEDHNDIVSPLPDIQYIKVVNFSKAMPPPRLQAAKAGVVDTPTPHHEKSGKRSKSIESPECVYPVSPAPSTPETASICSQDRPTVLRESVITERPSVFSVNPMARVSVPVVAPPVRTESVCVKQSAIVANTTVLKRTSSVTDTDGISSASKRPHTSYRSCRSELESDGREETGESEWPRMTPEQQHRVIMMRETSPPRAVPSFLARRYSSQSPPPPSPPRTRSPSSPLEIILDQRSPSPFHALDCPMEGGDMLGYESIVVPSPRGENNLLSSIFMEQDNGTDFVEEMLAGGVDVLSGSADVLRAGLILNVHDALLAAGERGKCPEGSECPPASPPPRPETHGAALRLVEEQLARSHDALQSRMDRQGSQLSSMVQGLRHVPRADKVFGPDITELKAEHRKQQLLLHSIQQDHRGSHCKEKLKVCTVKQDVGV
ncbi:basic helix-loop-helix ARNT-like protein 1 isoform X2 [Bacillus rossius redtenbacheri]|uniref:basic helix-loop-helix ARNT-like protein 1 isoform X2 n=1 Tax=Bacillus rossius redtenbacheri TaxID=93214 RepID=UPI002FDDD86A